MQTVLNFRKNNGGTKYKSDSVTFDENWQVHMYYHQEQWSPSWTMGPSNHL